MGKIQNTETLAVNDARRAALAIAESGLAAIDTEQAIARLVRIEHDALRIASEVVPLKEMGRLFFVGIGKCAVEAATAVERILGNHLTQGVVLDIKSGDALTRIKSFVGTHPLPSPANVDAARTVVEMLTNLKENDVVLFAISGGGSTLLCLPDDRSCEEEVKILSSLMHAGATIQEINTVRKHLSRARGGYLAKHAYPARVISLIFSDVPGNDLGFIASGPTVRDKTTIEDAEAIIKKYDILRACGIERCGLIETPKEIKYFMRAQNILAVSNKDALVAMEDEARRLGYHPTVCATCLTGEASVVGRGIAERLHAAPPKTVFLYGGETTVHVRGKGRGGRNLEMAAAALLEIRSDELILPFASDGRDNGDIAGAICDTITKEKAESLGEDIQAILKNNDEYPLFETEGHYLITGNTGSNVSDLVIAIKS